MNDGRRVGELMIERSRGKSCHDPEGFAMQTEALVREVHASGLSLGRIGVAALLQKMLVLCYLHQIKLESRFASVIIAIGVLEGVGRRLDPDVNILTKAIPFVMKAALHSDFRSNHQK